MAAKPTLKTAIGTYPYTRPLKDGSVSSPWLSLDHVEVVPANRAFRPMVNQLAYDVSELALVTLMLGTVLDRQIVGVPVIMMQQSVYGMLLVPRDSPLCDPRQLAGRTIGVRSYTQTTGVWLRGMLHDQFNLDLDTLTWRTFEPAHVDGFEDPPNALPAAAGASLVELLRGGHIDAAAGLDPAAHPDLRTLISDPLEIEADWSRQSGIRPINHTLVVRRALATAEPWIRGELSRMVRAAKRVAAVEAPSDGLEPNRAALAVLARYAFEQRITPRTLKLEEFFPGT
jgi:4,5-dihydroxyphthalate decarboxylase